MPQLWSVRHLLNLGKHFQEDSFVLYFIIATAAIFVCQYLAKIQARNTNFSGNLAVNLSVCGEVMLNSISLTHH